MGTLHRTAGLRPGLHVSRDLFRPLVSIGVSDCNGEPRQDPRSNRRRATRQPHLDPARYSRQSSRAIFEATAEYGQLDLCRNRQVDGDRGANHEHPVSRILSFSVFRPAE